MTVGELIDALGRFPADAPVALSVAGEESEDFTVERALDGDWVVLEG